MTASRTWENVWFVGKTHKNVIRHKDIKNPGTHAVRDFFKNLYFHTCYGMSAGYASVNKKNTKQFYNH